MFDNEREAPDTQPFGDEPWANPPGIDVPDPEPPDGPSPDPEPGPGPDEVPPSDPGEPPPVPQVAPGDESSPDFMRAG